MRTLVTLIAVADVVPACCCACRACSSPAPFSLFCRLFALPATEPKLTSLFFLLMSSTFCIAGMGGRLDPEALLPVLFTLELLFPKLSFHLDVFFAIVGADATDTAPVAALDALDAEIIEDAYAAASEVVEAPECAGNATG